MNKIIKYKIIFLFLFIYVLFLVRLLQYKIPIAYAADNNYVYPVLVSMTSILEAIGRKTFYEFYIMISNNFSILNKNIIKSIQKKYSDYCSIKFINMTNMFTKQKKLPTSQYYRLALHDILPNINKIIYLDSDTLIFKDLTELINLDMKGNFILGFIDSLLHSIDKYGFKNAMVLNTGVLLMDLEALRKFNATKIFKSFMESQNNNVERGDCTIINVVLQNHTNTLPAKYGMLGFNNLNQAFAYNNAQKFRYNEIEFRIAYKNPVIIHFTGSKPFNNKTNPYYTLWWKYVNLTGFYEKIYNYYH